MPSLQLVSQSFWTCNDCTKYRSVLLPVAIAWIVLKPLQVAAQDRMRHVTLPIQLGFLFSMFRDKLHRNTSIPCPIIPSTKKLQDQLQREYVKLQLITRCDLLATILSLIHIVLLSNSHSNVASIQKNRGDKSHRVIVALQLLPATCITSYKKNCVV